MPQSLSGRLVVLFSLLVTFSISAVGVYAYASLKNQLISRDEDVVKGKLVQVAHIIRETESKAALRESTHVLDDIARGHPGLTVRVSDIDGVPLYTTSTVLLSNAIEPDQHNNLAPDTVISAPTAAEFGNGQEAAIVQVEQSSRDRATILARFRASLLSGTIAGMVLTAIMGALLAARELRPTRRLVQQVHKIDVERLGYRVDVPSGPAEVRDIATAFNLMLERLQSGYERLYRFSADLAHDMRTPLTNLTGHAEVALSRERSAAEYARVIEDSLNEYGRLSHMIEAMLFLARADAANVIVEKVPISLSEELQKAGKYFSVLAEEHGVTITVLSEGNVFADPLLLRRCLNNLLANAVEHAKPHTSIQLRGVEAQDCTRIQITNEGVPIRDEDFERIFERFYRLDAARTSSGWSTGLGLAIVRSIMQLHGGTVSAQSIPGGLTRFELRFPRT